MIFMPKECSLKCDYINCDEGMNIAGHGKCYLNGMWWHNCCPNFVEEKSDSLATKQVRRFKNDGDLWASGAN